jgi:2-dehydropantoate 2-reductase
MKICVFGAGAIGGLMGAKLARVPGVELSVVARGAQLQAIQREGLRWIEGGKVHASRVVATNDPRSLGAQDVVFLTLKSQQLGPALVDLFPLLDSNTIVVPPTTSIPYWYFHAHPGRHNGLQVNALDPGNLQWEAISPLRVLGCVFRVAAETLEPGLVKQTSSYARLPLGEPDGHPSKRAERLADVMQRAGFDTAVVTDIRGWIWHKMISSMCWNSVAVLTRATWGELAREPSIAALVRRMMSEADSVADSLGDAVPISMDERMAAPQAAPLHKMSMLQDLEAGRPLEYQPIFESMFAMRDITGMPTPSIDEVFALLNLFAKSIPTPPTRH